MVPIYIEGQLHSHAMDCTFWKDVHEEYVSMDDGMDPNLPDNCVNDDQNIDDNDDEW